MQTRQFDASYAKSGIFERPFIAKVLFHHKHTAALRHKPMAYFVVCLTMHESAKAHCKEISSYLPPMHEQFPNIKLVGVRMFADAMDFKKLLLPIRVLIKSVEVAGRGLP